MNHVSPCQIFKLFSCHTFPVWHKFAFCRLLGHKGLINIWSFRPVTKTSHSLTCQALFVQRQSTIRLVTSDTGGIASADWIFLIPFSVVFLESPGWSTSAVHQRSRQALPVSVVVMGIFQTHWNSFFLTADYSNCRKIVPAGCNQAQLRFVFLPGHYFSILTKQHQPSGGFNN